MNGAAVHSVRFEPAARLDLDVLLGRQHDLAGCISRQAIGPNRAAVAKRAGEEFRRAVSSIDSTQVDDLILRSLDFEVDVLKSRPGKLHLAPGG